MCTNNWPLLLDLSRDECKRILRRLELEAYSAVLTAFRAQGDLAKDKKGILQELQNMLSISTERHRAEVRRVVNDEKLTTIADNMAGPDVSSEWQIEGRRLIPLMPRLVPQTAFTVTANNAASMQAEKNMSLPPPGQTGSKEVVPTTPTTPSSSGPIPASAKTARPSSPASNVVVLPSGMSIHIKGGLNTEDEDLQNKKRRRSSSTEAAVITKTTHTPTPSITTKPAITTTATVTGTAVAGVASNMPGVSPMKITFTKSPAKLQTTTVPPSQKVILVSTTHSGTSPGIIQKSMAVPVIKTTTTTGGTVTTFTSPRASIIMPASMASSVANGNIGNIITVVTSSMTGCISSSAVTAMTTANPTLLASSLNAARPRTKMITRPKAPMVPPRTGMVMQMGGSHMAGSPVVHGAHAPGVHGAHPHGAHVHGLHNIHVKPVHTKPTIHIKHEGGMKIITQGMPTAASKILPKPAGSVPGTPMVVMSSAQQPSITMVSKSNTSLAGQVAGGRVLNITTQGGKVIASSSNRGTAANVVTVNPKTLQLTAIKGAGGTTVLTTSGRVATATGAKPNVIVVQKAQPKRCQTATTPTITLPRPSTGASNSPFEKKQDALKHMSIQKTIITKQVSQKPPTELQHIRQRQSQPFTVKVRGDGTSEGGRSSLLAELIQSVGIQPDSSGEVTTTSSVGGDRDQDSQSRVHTVVVQQEEVAMPPNQAVVSVPAPTSSRVGGNRWVEYDLPRGAQTLLATGRDSSDTSAIKALLDLQTGAKQQRPKTMTNVVDLAHHSAEGIRISQHDRFSLGHPSSVAKTLTTSAAPGTTSISRPIHYTQRAQHIPETTNVVLEQPGGETVAVQLAGADLAHLTSLGQEIIGELDPETGIFYTTAPGGQETAVTIVTTTQPQQMATHQVVQRHQTVVAAPKENATGIMTMSQAGIGAVSQQPLQQLPAAITTKPIDFLSSALNQAQIDLDPYQFIDEDEPAFSTTKLASTPTVSVCAEAESSSQAAHQGQQLMTLFTPDSGTVNMATQQTIHSQDVTLGLSTDEVAVTGSASSLSMGMSVTQKHEQQDPMILLQQTPSTTTISPPPQQQPDNPQIELAHIQTPIQHKQQIHVQQQSRQIHALQHQPHIKVSTIANTRPIVSIATTTRTVAPTLAATRPAVSSLVTTCPVVSTLASMRSMVSTSVPVELPTLVPSTTEVFAPTTIHQAQLQVTPTLTLLQQAPVVSTIDAQVTATVDISPYEDPVSTSVHVSDEVPSSTTEGIVMDGGPSLTHHEGEVLEEMVVSDGIIEFEQHEVCVPDTASNVTVAVEPGGLDTTTMVIEDFTSQQLITETSDHQTQAAHHQSGKMITIEYQTHDDGSHISDTGPISPSSGIAGTSEGQVSSGGEGGDSGLSSPVRASQRKRRPPSMPDDSPPHGHGNMSSWVRHASSLLQKVSKYRGSRKEKGELNASAWFLAPVDPKEVPDYYTIIKKPMDFGTIRHKLETSQYTSWEDFHTDMLLVQENCRRYNPPGHEIRKDCDEVFSFYTLEYEWGRDKWQKMHLSPTHKKPRLDRSPMRT